MSTRYSCFWCGRDLSENHDTRKVSSHIAEVLDVDEMPICVKCLTREVMWEFLEECK